MTDSSPRLARLWKIAAPFVAGALAAAVLYYLRASHQTSNALAYIIPASEGYSLFHPHHLTQAAAVHLVFRLLGPFGCDAVCAGQLHSLAWAAIAIGSVFFLGRTLFRSDLAAVCLAVLVLVAHSFWIYATQAETYIPTVGASTLIAAILVGSRGKPGWWGILAGSLLLAISIGYHQANVLFLVPLALYMWACEGRRGLSRAVLIALLAGAVTLLAYVLAFASTSETRSFDAFIQWALLYSTLPENYGLLGHFGPRGLAQFVSSQVNTLLVLPEYFGTQRYAVLLVAPFILVSLVWNIVATWRSESLRAERLLFLSWYGVYCLFFIWWGPYVSKFFIPAIVPLTFLVAFSFRDLLAQEREPIHTLSRVAVPAFVGACIAAFGALNLSSVLYVHRELGPAYAAAAELAPLVPESCTMIMQDGRGELLYYGGKDSENVKVLYYGYFDYAVEDLASSSLFSDTDCIVMPIGHASRERFADRATRGESPLTPEDWGGFVRWVFAVEQAAADSVSHRRFELVPRPERPPLLLIRDSRTTRPGSPLGFVDNIEQLVAEETAGHGGQSPDGIPWSAIYRRLLIFGY